MILQGFLMSEFAKEIIRVNIEDEMRQSYLDYAMSVIVGRALPDVRDGLKPVHRRVFSPLARPHRLPTPARSAPEILRRE